MTEKLYTNQISWKQDYPEYINFLQHYVDEWERIVLSEREHIEAKELIERIKNGNNRKT